MSRYVTVRLRRPIAEGVVAHLEADTHGPNDYTWQEALDALRAALQAKKAKSIVRGAKERGGAK